jgi:voltage-gated sodium channel
LRRFSGDIELKTSQPTWRQRLLSVTEARRFQHFITVLIIANAAILGLETSPSIMMSIGELLMVIDKVILAAFVIELLMRVGAHGKAFFRDPWSLFDTAVVGVALVPASGAFSVLRALRVLRLASTVPQMRGVIEALFRSLPGLGSVVSIMMLIFYVAGVMATMLFSEAFPQWFGTLPKSLYSLFQIMTLESWSMGIVRPVMEQFPYAWAFFVPFILLATFTMLNLFVAVVVNAMQSTYHEEGAEQARVAHAERVRVLDEVVGLRAEIKALTQVVKDKG